MALKTFGIGIVGAGRVFKQHARACRDLAPRARLLAIAEIDEVQRRRAIAEHFIPFADGDYRSLLDRRDVDIVVVCTPPASHERIVIDALDAGKYVICEKPLAHSLEASDRILAAAERHPGRLGTVFQFRYLREVRRTRWLLDRGDLGRPLFGRFSRYARFESSASPGKRRKAPKASKERADWWGRWAVAGGGIVMTQCIHDLDLMCHFFGTPTEVSAVIDTLHEPIESEDSCVATVRFENRAVACCYGTMTAHRTANAFDIIGASASVHFPWALESTDRKRRDQLLEAAVSACPAPTASHRSPLRSMFTSRLRRAREDERGSTTDHTPYLTAVLDAVEAGHPLPVPPEDARATVELCTAIYTSALTQRPAALPLDDASPYYRGVSPLDYDAIETSHGRRQNNSDPPRIRKHGDDHTVRTRADIAGAAG